MGKKASPKSHGLFSQSTPYKGFTGLGRMLIKLEQLPALIVEVNIYPTDGDINKVITVTLW